MNEKLYLIWSIEHNAWWKPAMNGYTQKRNEAGKYPFETASLIVKDANIALNDEPNEAMVEFIK